MSKDGPVRTKIILLPIKVAFEAIVKDTTVALRKTGKKRRRWDKKEVCVHFKMVSSPSLHNVGIFEKGQGFKSTSVAVRIYDWRDIYTTEYHRFVLQLIDSIKNY